jgi:3-oxoacyl-[acyl-carrier protein] reductase
MRLTLEGKHALVTGGSRGIGRAVCVLFGRLGARVAVADARDRVAADATVEAVRSEGSDAFAIQADLSDPAAGTRLVESAAERLGGLDAVVVNHGIWKRAPIDSMTLEQWRETLSTNLDAAYAVSAAAARILIPRRSGAIVLVASTAGQRGEAQHAHYAASKGALLAFTRSLAAELAPHGVRVNCVSPGWVLTDMSRAALEDAGPAGPTDKIPLGRPGTPEEIAGPVAFLASELSSYVYGEVLCVNGGAVMAG